MVSTIQSVDVGNFAVKVYDGVRVRMVHSLIAKASSGNVDPGRRSETTRYFQYVE